MRWLEIEALLFAHGAPMKRDDIAAILEIGAMELSECLAEYQHALSERAFTLRELGDSVVLEIKPEYRALLERAAGQRRGTLSAAALETLAIIAYLQPVTRTRIEEMRGVRSDRSLATLLEEDLIAEAGHEDTPGRPRLFATTREFLRRFGLSSLSELPPSPLREREGSA